MSKKHPLVIPFLDHCHIHRPEPVHGSGECSAWIEPLPELMNSMGMAHGGLVMTLMDAAMGGACRSSQPEGASVVTIDMQAQFLAPARGRVQANAKVVRASRTLIFAECEVRGGDGELVAKASGLFRPVDRARMSKGGGKTKS
jgi:uncharacterized protein (TIGR00369 family)